MVAPALMVFVTGVFSAISAITPVDFNLTGVPEPERLYGARVSANLFTLLGVSPTAGRLFLAEENVEGRDRVVIISHELWTRRFGADRSILNRPLSLNGQTYQVVGVMPPGFLFPTGAQLHPLVPLGPRDLPQFQPELHVLVHRHVRVQGVVLKNHRDVAVARLDLVDAAIADADLAGADLL